MNKPANSLVLTHAERVMRAAEEYQSKGLTLARIRPGEKEACDKGWPDKNPEPHLFGSGHNLAFLPGKKSAHVADLDYDDPYVRQIASWEEFHADYPSFRRASLPRTEPGHHLVKCPDAPDKLFQFAFEKESEKDALKKAGIPTVNFAEIRTGGRCYTCLPPSRYKVGDEDGAYDELVWNQPFDPDKIPQAAYADVFRSTALIVFLSLARYCYPPKGGRNLFCLDLAGALIDLNVPADDAACYIESLAAMAGDEEADKRGAAAHATAAKKEQGEAVTGLHHFLAALGLEAVEARLHQWFGIKKQRRAAPIPPNAINIAAPDVYSELVKLDHQLSLSDRLFRQDSRFVAVLETGPALPVPHRSAARTLEARPVTSKWLIAEITRLRIDIRNELGKAVPPPEQFVKIYLDWCSDSRLPTLKGITHTPLLGRNQPGYDPDTGIYHAYAENTFPPIKPRPDKADALAALGVLTHPLRSYRFASEASRSVAIAAMLTATVRVEIASAPMILIDASTAGSGKSKLAAIIGIMALGRVPPVMTYAKSEEENRKRLEASLIARRPVIIIDNVSDIVDNDTLAAILTGEYIDPRIMGKLETVTVDTRTLIIATGNNMRTHGDMARRVLKCRIDPGCANPEERPFNFDPVAEALADHPRLVAAALTMLRAYLAAGETVKALNFGSYEAWAFIAQTLVWLGLADPNLTRLDVRANNPQLEERERIIALFLGHVGLGPKVTIRMLHQDGRYAAFKEEVAALLRDGVWNEVGAGLKLGALVGVSIGGLTLRSGKSPANVNQYWLEGEPTTALLALRDELIKEPAM